MPRFVPRAHYADSFGYQWNIHARTQLDSGSHADITRARFETATGWTNLEGQTVLEVGCGAGRFTEVLLARGARVTAVDASSAVDANAANHAGHPNLLVVQADLYALPFCRGGFDKVMCLGVLQHCPDVRGAFLRLLEQVRPGGEIAVDVYDLTLRALVNPKYWLRPVTTRLSKERLYGLVRRVVPILYPVRRFVSERVPIVGRHLGFFIPVAYHRGFVPGADALTAEQQIEWSILDTFDKLAPAYDRPQRLSTVRRWFREAELEDVDVRYGPNGIVGRGRRPAG